MVPRPYCKNDRSVRVLPATGYGVRGYGYGVGKSDPQVTRSKPYVPGCLPAKDGYAQRSYCSTFDQNMIILHI